MICPICGREIPDGSRFCTYCGANTESALIAEVEPLKEPDLSSALSQDIASENKSASFSEPVDAGADTGILEGSQTEQPASPPGYLVPQPTFLIPQPGYPVPQAGQQAPPAGVYTPPPVDPYASSAPYQGGSPQYGTPQYGTPGVPSTPQYIAPGASLYGVPGIPQYIAPSYTLGGPGQGTMPASGPQPTLQPMYGAYAGLPQQTQQPQQAPKKKKAGTVFAAIAATLVVIASVLAYAWLAGDPIDSLFDPDRKVTEETNDGNSNGKTDDDNGDDNGDDNSDNNGDDKTFIHQNPSDKILVENDICTISIGSQSYNAAFEWIEVEITVENKSERNLWLYFDHNVTADGLNDTAGYTVVAYPDENVGGIDFPANATTTGAIVFMNPPDSKTVQNFTGSIIIYDGDTFEMLEVYHFLIKNIDQY